MTIDAYLNKDANGLRQLVEFAVSYCDEHDLDLPKFLGIKIPDTDINAEYLTSIICYGSLTYILFKYEKDNKYGIYRLNIQSGEGKYLTEAMYKSVEPDMAQIALRLPNDDMQVLLMGDTLLKSDKAVYLNLCNSIYITLCFFKDLTFSGHWFEIGSSKMESFIFNSYEDFCNLLIYRFNCANMRNFFRQLDTATIQDFMSKVDSCIPSAFTGKPTDDVTYISYLD